MGLRVLVADDSYLLREGIAHSLARSGIDVVGAEGDLPSLRAAVAETEPDVVVTDIRMPPTHTDEGVRLACELAERVPGIAVVVLSQYALLSFATALFETGNPRRAYVLKDRVADPQFLRTTIELVASGQPYLDPRIIELFLGAEDSEAQVEQLTPREREVLARVADGASNAAIARDLSITNRAVERHMNTIFAKLGLQEDGSRNRRVLAALLYTRREG